MIHDSNSHAKAERKRRVILRHLSEHGESTTVELIRAVAGDPATSSAKKKMLLACTKLQQAGYISARDSKTPSPKWRLRDGMVLCPCGAGLVANDTDAYGFPTSWDKERKVRCARSGLRYLRERMLRPHASADETLEAIRTYSEFLYSAGEGE